MLQKPLLFFSLLLAFSACQSPDNQVIAQTGKDIYKIKDYVQDKGYEKYEVATLAGGCFWCTEAAFERINGVVDVISGYSGGKKAYPTYSEVSNKQTDHAEAIQIYYDPAVLNFEQILDIFFVAHDPTTLNRQGPDVGPQYRSEIFYHNDAQKAAATAKMQQLNASGTFSSHIVTALSAYREFWVAESYHQDYYEYNPGNPYVQRISKPKVEKVMKTFAPMLKDKYKK
ncbi:MAG: peptide-methionine (S)-S-oxide reductase MsrA [Saprospiraceae bacterium]|nr:peptide-methionine (S)-S-oxide reductase MsrA [Saprospiraceae bacterium]